MKIKVVILINELLRGGAQRIVVDIARGLDKEQFDLHVTFLKAENVFPAETKSLLNELLMTGVKVTSLGGRQRFSLSEFESLRKYLRHEKPDVLHTFLPYAGTVGRLVARAAGVRAIISTQCNVPVAYTPKVFWLDKLTLPLATAWTAATEGIEQSYGQSVAYLSSAAWQSGRRHFTIVAGVDPVAIQAGVNKVDRMAKRAELGIPATATLVTMTARLISWKGHSDVVDSLAHLPATVHVAFIGWGPLHETLTNRATALGVADRVHFLGSRSDVYEILAASDLYVQAHSVAPNGEVWRGPNTAQMEAAAAGVPMVSTAVPLVEELVRDGVTGKLTPTNDPVHMAASIQWLMDHPAEAQQMAAAAKALVAERYSLRAMVAQYGELYGYVAAR